MSENLSKDVEDVRIKQIASMLLLENKSQRAIAQELGIGETTVRRLMQKPEFKELMKELGDRAVEAAKAEMRGIARKLAPKAQTALESLLDDDSVRGKAEGLKYYFQLIGANDHEQDTGGGNITIQLPGIRQETVVPTEGREVQDAPIQDSED